ncbi:hypothetical protein BCEP4_690008 [Burkholderia cepacia]|nr:hypothetical protein BCEP4_690008 [Burkholderia cepacia]
MRAFAPVRPDTLTRDNLAGARQFVRKLTGTMQLAFRKVLNANRDTTRSRYRRHSTSIPYGSCTRDIPRFSSRSPLPRCSAPRHRLPRR